MTDPSRVATHAQAWQDEERLIALIAAAPQPVLQRGLNDCGVACAAMAAQVSYEASRRAFEELGLHAPTKRGRIAKPYSSNFQELRAVLKALGIDSLLRRFSGWHLILTPCVVKVRTQHKRDWHWVFASRDSVHGLHVLDPARLDPYIERLPLGMAGVPLDVHIPFGCYLEVAGAGTQPRNLQLQPEGPLGSEWKIESNAQTAVDTQFVDREKNAAATAD